MRHSALLLAFFLTASCGTTSQLESRFVAVHNTLSAMGFAQTGPISEGSLPEGGEATFDLELRGGACYAFLGLGTNGVRDVDVRVFDGETEIGRDVTHDSQAAARVCPTRTGAHRVVVTAVEGSGGYVLSSWTGTGAGSSGGIDVVAGGAGTCGEPFQIALDEPYPGTTAGGSSSMVTPCASGSSPERVHVLEIAERGLVSLAVESSFDGTLYILRECGNVGSSLGCNDDDGDTTRSRVTLTLDPGTYYVVVDGFGDGASGTYTLTASFQQMQALAAVCSALPTLVPGQPVSGSTSGNIDYFQSTCADGSGSPDQGYQLNVSQRSRLRVRNVQSGYDGSLYMRSNCTDSATEVACNDDFVDTSSSLITQFVNPGTYFVYADGYGPRGSTNAGGFTLTADLAPAAGGNAPSNTCGTAQPAPSAAFAIDTLQASDDFSGSCGGQGAPDVVYNLNITARSMVRVDLTRSEFDGVMYVRSTCATASTETYCAPITQGQTQSGVTAPGAAQPTPYQFELAPGQYALVFDGLRPESFGAAQVQISITDLAAQRRLCQQAPLLRPGRTTNGTTNGAPSNFGATCAQNAGSGEQMYRLRLTRRSDVRLNLTSTHDGALYIRRDCVDASTELACNDDAADNRHSSITTTLDRGTYFVFVDGFGQTENGDFSLEVEVGAAGSFPTVPTPTPPGRPPFTP